MNTKAIYPLLEHLAELYGQEGGTDSQHKVDKTRILRFELQLSQDPKNIEIYRDYGWFLKSIGKHNEARAVKKRIDVQLQAIQRELFQGLQQNLQALEQKAQSLEQKVIKQKTKIGGLKQTIRSQDEKIHLQAQTIHHLQESVQANATRNDTAHIALQTRVANFENVELPEQINRLNALNTQLETLRGQVQANATKNDTAHTALQTRVASFENVQLPEQINRLNTLNTQLETLRGQVQANAAKNDTAHTALQTRVASFENVQLPEQINRLNALNMELESLNAKVECSKCTSLSFFHDVANHNYYNRDADIIPLLNNNPYLQSLSLRCNRGLTNAVLSIIPNRFPNLEDLDLTHCNAMQLADLNRIVDQLPKLRRLMYYGLKGTYQQHNALIAKLNTRKIQHGKLNFE